MKVNGHELDLDRYHAALRSWGAQNFRDFPWRHTNDLYKLLVAEFMLLRTRATQVLEVYPRFIQRYPTVQTLANAQRADVRSELHSLGLQWRADYVYDSAQVIVEEYGGKIPHSKSDLIELPGVSAYIAGAVRCFGLNEPEGLIDTNTLRVSARLFLLATTDSSRRSKKFRNLIRSLVDEEKPRAYNYALLDLGDSICTKRRPPACPMCPLRKMCAYGIAALHDDTEAHPVRSAA